MLKEIFEPLQDTLFEGSDYYFQQDSTSVHKAKEVQQWLIEKVPNFIMTNKWPSWSPNLYPLNYSLWNHLEEIAYTLVDTPFGHFED